jgi:hypothetical protein
VVFVLVLAELLDDSLGLRVGSKLGKRSEHLTTGKTADVKVVAEDSVIGSRDGEGDLGESGIERFDSNDSVLLVEQSKGAEETVNFNIGVGRPDTNVITVLISDTRTFSVEFEVNTVTVLGVLEKFTGDSDRGRVGVLCVMNTLGLGQSTSRQFT